MNVPANWNIDSTEVSAGVYRIVATATDGRRIEMIGKDLERFEQEVIASIADSDRQVAERLQHAS